MRSLIHKVSNYLNLLSVLVLWFGCETLQLWQVKINSSEAVLLGCFLNEGKGLQSMCSPICAACFRLAVGSWRGSWVNKRWETQDDTGTNRPQCYQLHLPATTLFLVWSGQGPWDHHMLAHYHLTGTWPSQIESLPVLDHPAQSLTPAKWCWHHSGGRDRWMVELDGGASFSLWLISAKVN